MSPDLAGSRGLSPLEQAEQEIRRLKSQLRGVQDELEALRAQLAGRDQEIRELRGKITAKVNQVAVDGPTGAP